MNLTQLMKTIERIKSNLNPTLKIIKFICPDVLVKGADYDVHEIVGAKFVSANGGKVKTIPLTPGFSTTKSIEKMVQ